jgi:hypothetical protein
VARDNERARRRIKLVSALENFHWTTGARQKRCRIKTRSRTADDGDFRSGFAAWALFNSLLQCDLPPLLFPPDARKRRIDLEALPVSNLTVDEDET